MTALFASLTLFSVQPFVAFLGTTELWIVLGLFLLLFGGKKLPGLARSMGSSITQFRKGLSESADEGPNPKLEEGTEDKEQ